MSQNVPLSQTAPMAESPSPDAESNIRRRLGNWTSSSSGATANINESPALTVPLGEPASNAIDTIELMTGPTTSSDQMMTMDLQQAVPIHSSDPLQSPHTQPFQDMNPAIRARLDEQAARTVSYHTAELQEEVAVTAPMSTATANFQSGTLTAPFGSQTAPKQQPGVTAKMAAAFQETGQFPETVRIGSVPTVTAPMSADGMTAAMDGHLGATAPIAQDSTSTVPLSGQTKTVNLTSDDEIEILRQKIEADPDDTDLVLELALALNEIGERAEAHEILTSLSALFDAQGEAEQANRVRSILGEAGTVTMVHDSNATQPIARQTTDSLRPRTGTLSLRPTPAARDGRVAARQKTDERETPVFPARDVQFTELLPQIDRLSAAAATFFAAAEEDRLAGKFRSALDNLQMAVTSDPCVPSAFLRMAEVQLKLGYRRKALTTIEDLQQFETLFRSGIPDWSFARLRLHAEPFELTKVQRLVDSMIEDGNAGIAAPYAARLIEHLLLADRLKEAEEYADRICGMAPGETRSTLEAAILAIKLDNRGRAIDRWEFALRNGADPIVGKASMAALVAETNEVDHWRLICDVMPAYRATRDELLASAYRRTAEAAGSSALHKCTSALFFIGKPTAANRTALANAAGDRAGSPTGRAAAAAALARVLQGSERGDEYLASIRTTLTLFSDNRIPVETNWEAILGFTPSVDEMSFELGQELMKAGDASGAVDVLKQGYALNKAHTRLTQALADAFAKTNQLGSALTILDELAMSHRKAGRLDEMAAVLRQMSQLAPANIKVKSRLVDAYLQRGFVAEARAELIQRADLEERAGLTKEAIVSLQRAADLSWNLGFPQESFNLYDRILVLDPEDVANRSALVNLYLQVGRLSDAAEHQRAVVDLALTHGRKHEAIAALHQVIGLTPDDMTAYYQLGEALSSMGEFQQAEKVYRRIVLMNPDDAIAQAKATAMAALKEQISGT